MSSRLVRRLGGEACAALLSTRAASTCAFSSPATLQVCRSVPPLVGTPTALESAACLVSRRGFAAGGPLVAGPARIAHRGISSTSPSLAEKTSKRTRGSGRDAGGSAETSVQKARRGDRYDEITDKWIPEKPVTATETAGYGVVIAAGLAVALGAMWFSLKELVLESKEHAVFNEAVEKAGMDARVVVRVGTPMTSYGGEGRSRSKRARLAHSLVVDADGVEHVKVQGAVRGPRGKGTVHCDAFKDSSGQWQFEYLVVDVGRDRVVVVQPRAKPGIMREPEKVYAVGE